MNRSVQERGLVLFLVSLVVLPVAAAEPPTSPLFGVEVDTHTAMIRRVAVNEARGIIVTASDDKTARVWDLETGRLLNTLRFPIDAKQEGRLFALALHPNGRIVAVAGWTGWDWDGEVSVYLFDVDTGEMLHRLPGLPNVVGFLSFSKQGEFLAVGLGGSGGVRIYRATDLTLIAEGTGYRQTVLGIDFDGTGRMVTSSLDSYVRLYDKSFKLLKKQRVHEHFTPVFVRFSPDGTKLAVGSYSPRVAVLSANDLSRLYLPGRKMPRAQKDLPGVAWSRDGQSLYAIGDFTGSEETSIYRWEDGGRGPMRALPAARLRITALEPLRDRRLVYAAEDPVLGLMDATGAKVWVQGAGIADFRDIGEALRVSHDGAALQFAYERAGKNLAHFALFESEGIVPGPLQSEESLGPITESPHLAVTDFKDHLEPKLNGRPLLLDRREYSRSLAVAPDGQSFLLGSEWTLRLFDRVGQPLWQAPLPQIPWGLAITGNGRVAVAALSDGTIRWYKMKDGRELFALFPYKSPRADDWQWIAWTPQGFYDSSEYGDNYVGWHINRARDQAADFFRAVQFERILYRPSAVAEYFSCMLGMVDIDCAALSSPDLSRLTANAPPRFGPLTITPEEPTSGRAKALLRFSAKRRTLPIEDYAVFVNNIPVTPGLERPLKDPEREGFTREVALDLFQRDNTVRVEVSSGRSVAVAERYVRVPGLPATAEPAPGDLHLLAVGVNRFMNLDAGWQLHYAAKDAIALKRALEQLGRGFYQQVRSKILSDEEGEPPDKERIVEALEFIKRARAHDTVVVFLSSHGLSDLEQNYYLVPRDARPQDVHQVQQGQGEGVPSLIGWETLFEALRNTAGRRLLIVDSCKAKSIEGRFDAQWLKKRSASARFGLMVSSKGTENSLEGGQFGDGHGIFTYALLQGLKTACDGNCRGTITLRQLFDFIGLVVEDLRTPEAGQQTPQLSASDELQDMVLGRPTASWMEELGWIWGDLREAWKGVAW
ncbi:MAG: caspase family protein [Gammaproteobacteria bacterium]